ncbi:hypothetical protein D1007_01215 [Hordeum vulgare]|nr:hypothetical protein D1007_01215 [Hordeum vulgare]
MLPLGGAWQSCPVVRGTNKLPSVEMAAVAGVDGALGHRSSSVANDANYDPDNDLSNSDCREDSSTSSDDALKSLKKGFSNFCQDANFKVENNRVKVPGVGRDVFSVYSTKYFAQILKRMSIGRKDVISKYGFDHLLKFEKTQLPSRFIRWILGCVDSVSSQIIIVDEKIIPLSKDSVHFVLGLPNTGVVPMPNKERGRNFLRSRFNLSDLPNVTFFGNMLTSSQDLSEEDTFICFMVIAMSCFLFPSSNGHIHTDFLFLLEDPTATRGYNICFLIYEWIMAGINKYVLFGRETGRKPKAFDLCTYCLAVLYLDKLDFGIRVVEQGVPRILIWKGNMIKHFSELDRKNSNSFGRRPFKKEVSFGAENGAYHGILRQRPASLSFKDKMCSSYTNILHEEIIQGIIDSAHCDNIWESGFQNAQEAIASNVLKFLSGSKVSSIFCVGGQDTASKPGSAAKQDMSILSEDVRTDTKSSRAESGEHIDMNEKIKHVKSSSIHEPVKVIENIVPSVAANKHLDIGTSKNKLPLQPAADEKMFEVLPDALVTPERVVSKFVEHSNAKYPEVPVLKKFKARVCNITHRDQHFSLINTFPAGMKERNSYFQFSVQQTKGTFTHSTSPTDTNILVGGQMTRPQAEQSNYQMANHMSPIGRTNLFAEEPVKRKADIVAISPTSFSVRQGELAKNADHVYNNLIRPIAKRQHQSPVRVLEVVDVPEDSDNYIIIDELAPDAVLNKGAKDDLIILQPKSLLELPIEENEKFPVSNEDCMHYNSIIELAYTKGIQKRYALTYSMVHCNYVSLGQSLMPTGKVDNFLIPCFCRKFFEDCHPTISGRHHFFPHIGENILHYTNEDQVKSIATSFLGAASASRGKRLELSDTLFFPICLSNHWIVFAVDFKWKLFAFLDSLYDKDSFLHKSIREKFIKNFIRLWEIIFQTDQHNFKRFSRMYPHVPKQENGNDCGVFATKIMEIWDATLDLRKIFSQADIQHIRIQYMNQLFFWKKNTADKSLVTSFNFQGDFANNLPR